ncbi:hypothetical protein [Aeromonas dhakensis]|uniref:hypothetical protein n=1 Tax=Aeromonas dhakensis TaxID=196024 RepID=UPI003EC65444
MGEQQYGPQILFEAQAMYQAMKKGKTNYGRREVSDLITKHVTSLANTPQFRMALSSLVLKQPGWGRRAFINQLFDLIAGHFGIEAPHYVAPVNAWATAAAPEPVNLVVEVDDILDLDLDLLGPESPPWG